MSVVNSVPLIAAGDDGYQINRSVRLRSASFKRTFGTPTDNLKWTFSGWVKISANSTAQTILSSYVAGTNNGFGLQFGGVTTNAITVLQPISFTPTWNLRATTTALFRDPSAWYHIVYVYDSANATASERSILYVNNVRQTVTYQNGPVAQNTACQFNVSGRDGWLGNYGNVANSFDGYFAEFNFIDGQALTPSSFGETDTSTGVWKPKKYVGTYGNNGFYLNFSDNSAATATTIGKDYSGNGNNFTPTNISVTAGSTYDSMLDVPTMWADGGNGRGNYATLNPLHKIFSTGVLNTTSGNLNITTSQAAMDAAVWGSMSMPSGKFYWEVTVTGGGASPATSGNGYNLGIYNAAGSSGVVWVSKTGAPVSTTYTTNDVLGFAVDAGAGTIQFYKNGSAAGTAQSYSFEAMPWFYYWGNDGSTAAMSVNFGQRPFAYTPPTGFKALNTQNLPDSTIKKGNAYFDVMLYTGNGDTSQTRQINGLSFQPNMSWVKSRSAAESHIIQDSVRGTGNILRTELTAAELTGRTDIMNGFTSSGFIVGNVGTTNTNGGSYASWNWKESASAGFDIVTYTGTGSAQTVAHSLGVAPKMMIARSRSAADDWRVYHQSIGAANYLDLNLTHASAAASTVWNNTAPSSSVLSVGTTLSVNAATYVAYLFAEVAGYSKFGSYTGNNSTDGPFVYCGFRPRYVMVKLTSGVASWLVIDTARDVQNVGQSYLMLNTSGGEGTAAELDILSNGFKLRTTDGTVNNPGATYIYAAFAENPFKNSLAR